MVIFGRALLLAILSVTLICCSTGPKPLAFSVTFDDADGLQVGQFLVYKGIRIGEVKSVVLDSGGKVVVGVSVEPAYRSAVYREAEFRVEKPGGFVDLSGEKQLTMSDRVGTRSPLQEGDIIEGTGGMWGHYFGKAQDAGFVAWQALAKATGSIVETFSGSSVSPEVEQFADSLKEFAFRAQAMTEDQLASFKLQTIPRLTQQAEHLKNRLESDGQTAQANEFWESFSKWAREATAESSRKN